MRKTTRAALIALAAIGVAILTMFIACIIAIVLKMILSPALATISFLGLMLLILFIVIFRSEYNELNKNE
jgi:uncharacterized membrane protein